MSRLTQVGRLRVSRARIALLGVGLTALIAGGAAVLASGSAQATTGGSQYPEPSVFVPLDVQTPVLGRFYLREVGRGAKVISAQLDIAAATERIPEFMVGEVELYLYGPGGRPTEIYEELYPWQDSKGTVTAEIVNPDSFNAQTPDGVDIGKLSLFVPHRDYGLGNRAREANRVSGELTLNGRGPYKVSFRRGDDDSPPPVPLPKAKQIGPK